jgi:hypothetical protein
LAKKQHEEWVKYLTSERREQLESVGVESVQFDVLHHRYRKPDKHYAALAWLGEKRKTIDRREKIILRVGVATLFVAGAGLIVAAIQLLT